MDGLVFVYLRCMQRAQNVVSHVLKSVVSVHNAFCALLGLLVAKHPGDMAATYKRGCTGWIG